MRHVTSALAGLLLVLSARAAEPDAKSHWAFRPPTRPAVPSGGHPIDAFLAVERQKHGLTPLPPADKRTLIRRVYLDLVGLPPTPAEVNAFLNDDSSDAYEKVVDRLLASPRYGERWARHWMDVWRYSDWDGFGAEVRNSQPHIWRWRDWIVESLNADKGYDQMIVEMIAGDEVAPDDPATLRATGFLARNWFMFNRNIWLESAIEHTSKAFLGLTMNCARCHDHEYDPITQQEYYQFRAIFEPHEVRIDRIPGQPDTKKDGVPRVYDAKLDAPTHLFQRGDEAKPDRSKRLAPGLPAMFAVSFKPVPVALSRTARFPDRREFVIREALQASEKAIVAAGQALQKSPRTDLLELDLALAKAKDAALKAVLRAEQLEDGGKKDSAEWQAAAKEAVSRQRDAAVIEAKRNRLLAEQERAKATAKPMIDAADKKLAAAKDALAKAEAAQKGAPTTAYTPRSTVAYPATSSGRRLALAKWITRSENPLTARVAVNHLWMRHFGRPLVPTVFDFGRNGQPPSHPALLDWLATDLVRGGWRMKALHRLIVTSAAYQMRSDFNGESTDPENRWLARFPARRLEAEAVRDSVLHVAGSLDPTMGGPELDQSLGLTVPRRSIYFRHSVEKYVEMLKVFDSANVIECYRREESIVPQQALALANNPLVLSHARRLARQLAEHTEPGAFVAAAYEHVLGRLPRPDESAACVAFLAEQATLLADAKKLTAFAGPAGSVPPSSDPKQRAREDLVHVLFNHHEFVTLR